MASNHEDNVKTALGLCLRIVKYYEWLLDLYVLVSIIFILHFNKKILQTV